HLVGPIARRNAQRPRRQSLCMTRVQTVAAVVLLACRRGSVNQRQTRTRLEVKLAGLLYETAGERSDQRVDGIDIDFGVSRSESPYRLCVLHDRVLKSAARPEKRAAGLPSEANRLQSATRVGVRAGGNTPDAVVLRKSIGRLARERRRVQPIPMPIDVGGASK